MMPRSSRRGFSLLEVMIATAVLAGSAMVLMSLISLGTRFGSKAELRMGALVQAQSILDETLLRIAGGESIESYTGIASGTKPRSYRVTVELFPLGDATELGAAVATQPAMDALNADRGPGQVTQAVPGLPEPSELVSVKVELYETEGMIDGRQGVAGPKPLIALTRLVRRAPVSEATAQSTPMRGGR